MIARNRALKLAMLGLLFLSSCHGEWRRHKSPVRLVLTAALIAPGKESGKPWDGLGSLPPEVVDGLRAPRSQDLTGSLFRALLSSTGMDAVVKLLPWTANAFLDGIAAPDVQIEILLDGQLLQRSPMVGNSHHPTWGGVYTLPVNVRDNSQLEIHAIDRDLAFDDEIGVCTTQGMPLVDQKGYVSGQTWRCMGQLWSVALRIVPVDRHHKPATEISPKAEIDERD